MLPRLFQGIPLSSQTCDTLTVRYRLQPLTSHWLCAGGQEDTGEHDRQERLPGAGQLAGDNGVQDRQGQDLLFGGWDCHQASPCGMSWDEPEEEAQQ